jgi:glycosyltransferase involved in cell wall biosynthesis
MNINLISIVLPVHNQGDHIRELILSYIESIKIVPVPFEIILVVNNNRDSSLAICQELASLHPMIRVIHIEAGGWGLSVRLGLRDAHGDLLCYTNSARTRPEDLLLFLLYGISNPNVVIKANRKIRDNWRRRLGSLIYNLEVRFLFDLAYWDINGTPKVFPRSCEKLMRLEEDGDLIDAEFSVICRRSDYHVIEVPVVSVSRRGGKSTTNYVSAFRMYVGAIRLWKKMGTSLKETQE